MAYWPASLCSLVGRYENPMPELTLYSQSGTLNLAKFRIRRHVVALNIDLKMYASCKQFDYFIALQL